MKKVSKLILTLLFFYGIFSTTTATAQIVFENDGGCPAITITGPMVLHDNFGTSSGEAAVMTHTVRFDIAVDWTGCSPSPCAQLAVTTLLGTDHPGTVSYMGFSAHGGLALMNAQSYLDCSPTDELFGEPVFGLFPGPTTNSVISRFSVVVSWDHKPERVSPEGILSVFYIDDTKLDFSLGLPFFHPVEVSLDVDFTLRYTSGARLTVPLYPRFPKKSPPEVKGTVPTNTGDPLTVESEMSGPTDFNGTHGFVQSAYNPPPSNGQISQNAWNSYLMNPLVTGTVRANFDWQRNMYPFNSWSMISNQNNKECGTIMICEGVKFRTRTKATLTGAPTISSNWSKELSVGPVGQIPTEMYTGGPIQVNDYRIVHLNNNPLNTTWTVSQGAHITNSTNTSCTIYIDSYQQTYVVTATYSTPCGTASMMGFIPGTAPGFGNDGNADERASSASGLDIKVVSANQVVQLELPGTASGKDYHAKLFDMSGKQQVSATFEGSTLSMDVSTLPSAVYVLVVTEGGKALMQKKLPLFH